MYSIEAYVTSALYHVEETEVLTCSIANLCISWSLQAGIISLSTPNSSFILDLRLRSIKLCAVFRAILRPAAVVLLACFFLPPAAFSAGAFASCFSGCALGGSCASFGFICMILRDLVGGGGRE